MSRRQWTFLTLHALVLLEVARDPDATVRVMAQQLGISERAVQRALNDLQGAGYVHKVRNGRRNHYDVDAERPLRHPRVTMHPVSVLLDVLRDRSRSPDSGPRHATVDS